MTVDKNPLETFFDGLYNLVDGPVVWFREKVVKPNQTYYPWYHQKFRRVPTIDQCYEDDRVCEFEADVQFKRDKMVDSEIISILRQRYEECVVYHAPDVDRCMKLWETYKLGEENWFIKYGDLGAYFNARKAYMKQKHRMLWERRHGPVGTGMKTKD